MSQPNELINLLDLIWRSTDKHATASEIVNSGISNLALIPLLKSVFKAIGGQWLYVETNANNHDTIELKHKNLKLHSSVNISFVKSSQCIMHLKDANIFLNADSAAFYEAWGEQQTYELTALLLAMQYARDRSDSLLFLPSEARSKAIEAASTDLGVSSSLLISLCVQPPDMRQHVEHHIPNTHT